MGPLATADLFQKIVRMTDAACDNDHIRIYIDNNAQIPDRTAAILSGGPDPVPAMLDSVNKLSSIGADVLIMPCNTAHYFLPRLRESSTVPFISMLEETALACKQAHGAAPVGLLGTSGTIRSGIYKKALEAQQVPWCRAHRRRAGGPDAARSMPSRPARASWTAKLSWMCWPP